ncbi:MAG: sodium:solute symporter family protein [Candidatus Eisenbacteria bacterium]|nr:sodium:solute symporter family protein [Candidatus Eisenbacteria bacterium]
MSAQLAVVLAYLGGMLAVSAVVRRRPGGHQEFFLAGRTLGALVLLGTMAATNFSAFTVVGFSGAGYRMGFAFYPVMAYGTGLMALTFIVIGIPALRIGRELGLVTPAELVEARFGSPTLGVSFAAVQAFFTLPYLALQPLAAGYVIEGLLGVPHALGAAAVTAVVVCYVLAGGMRTVAWTDVVQGLLMFAALAVGLGVVVAALGGWGAAMGRLAAESPAHLARPGAGGGLTVGIWASYMALWFTADPMLPQLFQRFYAAKDERSLVRVAASYPAVTTVLFFIPVAMGAFGRLLVPGLEGQGADRIFPLLMERFGGTWLHALAATGVLAAIMSTMDSQLLTLASIVERDILRRREPAALGPRGARSWEARAAVAALAVAGLLLALRPPATMLAIATEAFAGFAVLFPVVVAALYWRRVSARAAVASIAAGEAAVIAYHFKVLPTFGLLPAVPATAVAAAVLVIAGLAAPSRREPPDAFVRHARFGIGRRAAVAWAAIFAAFCVLSTDWWRFDGRSPAMVAGLPEWVLQFIVVGFVLAVALAAFGRRAAAGRRPAGPTPPAG